MGSTHHHDIKQPGKLLKLDKLNLLPPMAVPDELRTKLEQIQDTAQQHLASGESLKALASKIGIGFKTLLAMRMKYPAFKAALELASFEGSTIILEKIREIALDTRSDTEPHRMRAQVDALAKYLELRWPERFGKRIDLTVKTLDMGDALSKARTRAGITLESVAYVVQDEVAECAARDAQGYDDLL